MFEIKQLVRNEFEYYIKYIDGKLYIDLLSLEHYFMDQHEDDLVYYYSDEQIDDPRFITSNKLEDNSYAFLRKDIYNFAKSHNLSIYERGTYGNLLMEITDKTFLEFRLKFL